MKIKIATAVLCMTSSLAFGQEVCQSLEYQEMKDMNQSALLKEFCTSMHSAVQNASHAVHASFQGKVHSIVRGYGSEAEKCENQANRIKRVLESKGMENVSYDNSCGDY